MMPERVVVPLDGSARAEQALCVARPLARDLGVELVAMTRSPVVPTPTAEAYLDGLVRVHATGMPPESAEVVYGLDVPDAIRKVAEERDRSLVCMTTHGRGRLRWAAAGSVAEEVIRESTAPLLLVGPQARNEWASASRRIVLSRTARRRTGARPSTRASGRRPSVWTCSS